jgi:hypothetical protein
VTVPPDAKVQKALDRFRAKAGWPHPCESKGGDFDLMLSGNSTSTLIPVSPLARVNSPNLWKTPQPAAIKREIILPRMSGLPCPKCYSESGRCTQSAGAQPCRAELALCHSEPVFGAPYKLVLTAVAHLSLPLA